MAHQLSKRREIFVPRTLVYDAWTQPAHLDGWYVAADSTVQRLEVTPSAAGRWLVSWTDAAGADHVESGTFARVSRPALLSLNLRLEAAGGDACETELTVTLADRDGACGIEVRHDGFPSEAWLARWAARWDERLQRLEAFFSVI